MGTLTATNKAPPGDVDKRPAAAASVLPSCIAPIAEYLLSLSGRASLSTLDAHLRSAHVCRADLEPFLRFGVRGYVRNTIVASEHFELLALCWRSGHATPIHDHHGSSCAFKVVHGTGTEIRFSRSPSGLVIPEQSTTMPVGYVCAAEDNDIHQVANTQAAEHDLITLHIYSPPIRRMKTYDPCSPAVTVRNADGHIDGCGV